MQSLSGGCRWRGLVRCHSPTRSILRATAQAHLLQSCLGFAPRSAQRSSANQLGAKSHNSRLIDFEHHHHVQWLRRLRVSVKPDGCGYLSARGSCRCLARRGLGPHLAGFHLPRKISNHLWRAQPSSPARPSSDLDDARPAYSKRTGVPETPGLASQDIDKNLAKRAVFRREFMLTGGTCKLKLDCSLWEWVRASSWWR